MKTSVTLYSFSQYVNAGKLTQLDCIAKAKELGFDGIEFTDLMPPEKMLEQEYALLLKEEAQRCGLTIISHTVGANLLSTDA